VRLVPTAPLDFESEIEGVVTAAGRKPLAGVAVLVAAIVGVLVGDIVAVAVFVGVGTAVSVGEGVRVSVAASAKVGSGIGVSVGGISCASDPINLEAPSPAAAPVMNNLKRPRREGFAANDLAN
jgi:hypothetical protein